MFVTVKSYMVFLSYQGNYVACLIAMLQLMDEKHYQKYVAHFPSDQDLLVGLYCVNVGHREPYKLCDRLHF